MSNDINSEAHAEPTFMNLQSDYAFKVVFGSEKNKEVTIQFLNAMFEGEFIVNDLRFHDKEALPSREDGKRILYDVYCTHIGKPENPDADIENEIDNTLDEADNEEHPSHCRSEHFIIEMQNSYEPLWESRAISYTAAAIYNQCRRGKSYAFSPVFSIFLMDFNLAYMSKRLKHDVRLADIDTHERLTEDVRLIFLSLRQVKNTWEECDTELERMLYLIKNIHKMDKESKPYEEKNYYKLFHASEVPPQASEEYVYYSQSVDKMRENQRAIAYQAKKAAKEAIKKGLAEGRAQGIAEGRAEGRAEGMLEQKQNTVKNLHKAGIGIDIICLATELSRVDVERIVNSL